MVANAYIDMLFGGYCGDHALGTKTKDAGVSISAGTITFDTSQAHTLIPRNTNTTVYGEPTGYHRITAFISFTMSRDSAAPGATHIKLDNTGNHMFKITEDTSRVWTISVNGVTATTYTPTGTHHVYIAATKYPGAGSTNWANTDTVLVTVLIDKVRIFNGLLTGVSGSGGGILGDTQFGDAAIGSGTKPTWTLANIVLGMTDRQNPIGKITLAEWTWRLGITPPTGHDQSTKSTGTDAAALIDERPPVGTGTTDGDTYQLIDDGTHLSQVNALAQNILSAGDVLYAVGMKAWARSNTSGKLTGAAGQMHDGTNRRQWGQNLLINGPTSYAEVLTSGGTDGGGGDATQSYVGNKAPDGTAWNGKDNSYLNGCYAGMYMNGSTANASMLIDAIVMETAIVLSGDAFGAFDSFITKPPSARVQQLVGR